MTYELFDVRKKTAGFFTYHGFLTIASSSRIISREDYYYYYYYYYIIILLLLY
jgi:hypothetical protein